MPHTSQFFSLITRTLLGKVVQIIKLFFTQNSPFPITLTVLKPNILLNTILIHVPPLMWAIKFHTHTKQQQNFNSMYLNIRSLNIILVSISSPLTLDTRRCCSLQVDCSDIYSYFFNKDNGEFTSFERPSVSLLNGRLYSHV
jgi:hypothetical protein